MDREFFSRVRVLQYLFWGVFLVFGLRLFELQVLEHDQWYEEAKAQHEKRSVLPTRRGKVLVRKNRLTDELTPLATNNTLKMLFVDPVVLHYPKYNPKLSFENQEKGDPNKAAEVLAPILIHAHCEIIEGCHIETDPTKWSETERASIDAYQKELERIFSEIERRNVILVTDLAETRAQEIRGLRLRGIAVQGTNLIADPTRIDDLEATAHTLAPLTGIEEDRLQRLLERRPKRYVEITHKIVPQVSEKILELKEDPRYYWLLRGVQLRDEHWRYYPEKSLASQVLGFVDSNGEGQYGLEYKFQPELRGKEGYIFGATNIKGQRILGKGSNILRGHDGADIVISIDRILQGQVEKILQEDLKAYDADSAQAIVLEPSTGKILAMAHAPSFDPNEFGKVFARYEIPQEQEQTDREDETFNQRIPTIFEKGRYFRYFNLWGPQVFRNKIIADVYEPGSVMKAITMAAALNADEVTPQTTFNDTGPIEVEEFKIRNSEDEYHGETNMIEVLSESLNTGIAFITQKMGAKLLYEYLQDFGFGQVTDIKLEGEEEGRMEHWSDWSTSELITRGFGQGLTSTPLQMAVAFSALANGGYLMKPFLVEEIRYADGSKETFDAEVIRKVVSEKTYQTVKSMLLNAVNNGIARGARVWGHTIMGKTGTSQTYRHGKALSGEGTTITSFAGFGPMDNPQFVILVKYDFPKFSQWGSETAAITFRKIATFLFDHLGIPPDR